METFHERVFTYRCLRKGCGKEETMTERLSNDYRRRKLSACCRAPLRFVSVHDYGQSTGAPVLTSEKS